MGFGELGRYMFGRDRLHMIEALGDYLILKERVEQDIKTKQYRMSTELAFLHSARNYFESVTKVEGNVDGKLDYVRKEITDIIQKTHPTHRVKLQRDFPEILPVLH